MTFKHVLLRYFLCAAGALTSVAAAAGAATVNYGYEPPNFDPPAGWRPYAASSPWNQRLPDYPRIDANSSQKLNWLFSSTFGGVDSAAPIGMTNVPWTMGTGARTGGQYPYYFSRYSDPVVTINCTAGWGHCPLQGARVHIPSAAQAAPNSDGHLVLVLPDASEIDVWQWGTNEGTGNVQRAPWWNGETVNIGWGGRTNVVSSNGWDEGAGGGSASLSGTDGLGGQIRIPELQAGSIPHAVRAEVFCSPVTPVYPSQAYPGVNTNCNGAPTWGNAPVAMGTRLYLTTLDATINTYRLTNVQKTLLHELHDYGLFVTDDNHYNALAFDAFESAEPGVVYGNDTVDRYEAAALPRVGSASFDLFSDAEFRTYIVPYLRVLAPCVTTGNPSGRC